MLKYLRLFFFVPLLIAPQATYVQQQYLSIDQRIDYCGPIDNILQQMQTRLIKVNGCQKSYPMSNFNPLRIAGKWYAYQMYNFGDDVVDLTCSADYFAPTPNSLRYTAIDFPLSEFTYGEVRPSGFEFIRVIDTDYDNYIIWHACLPHPKTGKLYERVDVATRSYRDVSAYEQFDINRRIAEKIFQNSGPVNMLPYGRCNCLLI